MQLATHDPNRNVNPRMLDKRMLDSFSYSWEQSVPQGTPELDPSCDPDLDSYLGEYEPLQQLSSWEEQQNLSINRSGQLRPFQFKYQCPLR
jgi:hypothetical protein